MYKIGIDIGGTRIKGVLLRAETGEVIHQEICPTNQQDEQRWKGAVQETFMKLQKAAAGPIKGVGLSAPGLPNPENTAIICMPGRLPGLENFVWTDFLGVPTNVLNDAHAALMAEAKFGAASTAKNAIMLTLGTGVGGGLLLNGQLYQGFYQMAGHLGHISVDADSDTPSIVTGIPGNLEDAIGNETVPRRTFGRYQNTHELVEGYLKNEPLATQVWLTSIRRLAVALASLANAFSPELIVLGGGITQADEALLSPLQVFMDIFEWRPAGKKTTICKAHFADWAGAIGAAGAL